MKKAEKIKYINEHQRHREGFGSRSLPAWNIKIYGRGETIGKFDKRWDEKVEKDEMLFWNVCEDVMREYFEDKDYIKEKFELEDFTFYTEGRSGGWLVLDSIVVNGQTIKFNDEIYGDLDLKTLNKIVKIFEWLDSTNWQKMFNDTLQFYREMFEEEIEEVIKTRKAERDFKRGEREVKEFHGVTEIYA